MLISMNLTANSIQFDKFVKYVKLFLHKIQQEENWN